MTTICEGLMMACFGLSWPLNVAKSLRARSAKGKSIFFEIVIILGYICGICGKIYAGAFNFVLALYFINLCVVSIDLGLTIRNKRLDIAAEKASAEQLSASESEYCDKAHHPKIAYECTHIETNQDISDSTRMSENSFIPSLAKESLRQLR